MDGDDGSWRVLQLHVVEGYYVFFDEDDGAPELGVAYCRQCLRYLDYLVSAPCLKISRSLPLR